MSCDGKVTDMIKRQVDRQAREGKALQRTDRIKPVQWKKRQTKEEVKRQVKHADKPEA